MFEQLNCLLFFYALDVKLREKNSSKNYAMCKRK